MAAKRLGESEMEREARRLKDAQAKAAKRHSASVRQKEAKAMAAKRLAETGKEKEPRRLQDAQAKRAKRQAETEKEGRQEA